MRWSSFRDGDGVERVGLWDGEGLRPVRGEGTLLDLIRTESLAVAADDARSRPAVDPSTVTLLPPIPRPPSIRDFMAFEDHVVTSFAAIGAEVDPLWYQQPVFYFTNPTAVHGARDSIRVSPGSAAFDYELEIAAVIGREGADLDPTAAVEHIAGYMLFCDWSARDVQSQEMRLNLGPAKGKDSAHSCGPWMLTPDELAADAAMTASVNGRPCSSGRLDALSWSFGDMIAYASRGTRVLPGDVIGSGTVGTGCLLELSRTHGLENYPWLQPGDTVCLAATGLGAIEARIAAARPVVPLRKETG